MILQAAEPSVTTAVNVSRLNNSATADRELQRRIRSFLSNRLPQSSRLRIEADNGVVTLHGTHTSFYHKQLCINCCQRVAGVVQLIDTTKVIAPG
jgi:osmotically-inducible protein OsmY